MVNTVKGKVVCCIVARTNSTRLPNKVLQEVSGRSMIEHIIERMKLVFAPGDIYIATSDHPDDLILSDVARDNDVKVYRGSELSVIDRLLDIAERESAEFVVRVTGDNIYTDSKLLALLVSRAVDKNVDYARVEGAPIGVTAEVMKVSALKRCLNSIEPKLSEYLMLYMFNPEEYYSLVIDVSSWVPPLTSLTVDTPKDWERTRFIEGEIGKGKIVTLSDIVDLSLRRIIPNFFLDKSVLVKLPEGKSISLEEFSERQSLLAKQSQVHMVLSQEEYDNV